ncbi:MAG: pyruvate kinase [Candidatus Dojkabacteria bacterium]|nr:pyruvate kinase [Candidatus Dojkabacteria bacterium]MDQ7020878.1 pyruvate kinase [Candidatus Dojkabacteria bacterium]
MLSDKKNKIVCTIGPSSWVPEVMEKMIDAGMNCARYNGAFADWDSLEKVTKLVRDLDSKVALMIDVKGPQIRMNNFAEAVEVKIGDEFVIGSKAEHGVFTETYPDLYKYLKPGQKLLLGDGDTELEIVEIKDSKMFTKVTFGTKVKPGKGITAPGAEYPTVVLTEKDKENIENCKKLGWDFVSASFIRNAKDALEVKEVIDGEMQLIAKIENEEGVENIKEIVDEVDGIMIGRGDLGLQLGLERVPMVQRIAVAACNEMSKPVITATQMLESMIEAPKPTRGEANDVATAILMGTDCTMLSAETTTGKYPVEAVSFMTKISYEIEKYNMPQIIDSDSNHSVVAEALTKAGAELCINLGDEIKAIICVTSTGNMARLLSRHSLDQNMYAFVENEKVMRQLALTKGVNEAFLFEGLGDKSSDRDVSVEVVREKVKELGLAKEGEKIFLISKSHEGSTFFTGVFEVVTI